MPHSAYQATRFLTSAAALDQLPPDQGQEIAFSGRSNAGKSSVINALCHQKRLAYVSKTPGHTQMLNAFEVTQNKRLIDLPGYGYAKVPPEFQHRWQQLVTTYLHHRQSLCGIMLITDIRHALTESDWQMLAWCTRQTLPVHIVLNKADKLAYSAACQTDRRVRQTLQDYPQVSVQLFSALRGIGVPDAQAILDTWLTLEDV